MARIAACGGWAEAVRAGPHVAPTRHRCAALPAARLGLDALLLRDRGQLLLVHVVAEDKTAHGPSVRMPHLVAPFALCSAHPPSVAPLPAEEHRRTVSRPATKTARIDSVSESPSSEKPQREHRSHHGRGVGGPGPLASRAVIQDVAPLLPAKRRAGGAALSAGATRDGARTGRSPADERHPGRLQRKHRKRKRCAGWGCSASARSAERPSRHPQMHIERDADFDRCAGEGR